MLERCSARRRDGTLFDPDDRRGGGARHPGHTRLANEDRAYNRALAKRQALSRALDEKKRRLEPLLAFQAREVRPRTEQTATLRSLAAFLDARRLTKP